MIDAHLIHQIMALAGNRAETYAPHLEATAFEFEINTPERVAAWLAQLAHESGELRWVRELASGAAYEGRKDLGNLTPGDGVRYKGRGLIQITGRSNYGQASDALDLDCIKRPELLEEPRNAARVSGWFWFTRGLNELADRGEFERITRRINGGLNGYADRLKYWKRAKESLGC